MILLLFCIALLVFAGAAAIAGLAAVISGGGRCRDCGKKRFPSTAVIALVLAGMACACFVISWLLSNMAPETARADDDILQAAQLFAIATYLLVMASGSMNILSGTRGEPRLFSLIAAALQLLIVIAPPAYTVAAVLRMMWGWRAQGW